ncbi:MAG: soluble lytic murein transglycosylase [Blastocatellia bacterium]|jgi:soluble lytic murein transglycosylase|nr:soluble lytic murein transglycosylase [Blastocatellia bacterium]
MKIHSRLLHSLTLATLITGGAVVANAQTANDATLSAARRDDRSDRASGEFTQLSAAEHMRRANAYTTNRAFGEAREHWQAVIENYPTDINVPAALFGLGRSNFQERHYEVALRFLERVARQFPQTRDGREGLNASASALLRLGRPAEAANRFREYIEAYPEGERLESAHLNVIDSLREAGQQREAKTWVSRTRERFPGTVTETNALFGGLRLHIAEGEWRKAAQMADELLGKPFQKSVLTTVDEVVYLKAYSLERAGRIDDAIRAYITIPATASSYYGGLATEKLAAMDNVNARSLAAERAARVRTQVVAAAGLYPTPYRAAVLRFAKGRGVDPRLVLAVMREESQFKPRAKSPAAARGLLQLTLDTAAKYAPRARVTQLNENLLYEPDVSIAIGSVYLAELSQLFPNLPEAVAASYNGGEDNVARWVKRARNNDHGIFTSEVGFAETKTYVFRVISSYRAYQQLYTADLVQR